MPIAGGDKVFTTRQLFDICRQAGTFYESELECMNLHGKDMGFFQFIRLCDEFVDCEVVLLDDAIGEPWNIQLPRRNVSIRILNVDTLQ